MSTFHIYNDYVLYSINFGGILQEIFNFLRNIYLFLFNLPWNEIIFWLRIIAIIFVILFIIGTIRNLIGIEHEKKKEIERERNRE